MPQIDKVAYFSQILWVFGLFAAFYAIVSVEVLSGISTIYTVRRHIRGKCLQDDKGLIQEDKDVEFNYNSLIKNSCSESKRILNRSIVSCSTWANDVSNEVSTVGMKAVNESLLGASKQLVAQKYLFKDCLNSSK